MYILYAVEYPDAGVIATQVQNAWTAARLPQPVPTFPGPRVEGAEIRGLVERTLGAAGAVPSGGDGDVEVPRSSGALLEKLEEFYHRLYPHTRTSGDRRHFHYEELEWLGEF